MVADPERREIARPSAQEQQIQQGNAAKSSLYIKAFRIVVRAIFVVLFRVRIFGPEERAHDAYHRVH